MKRRREYRSYSKIGIGHLPGFAESLRLLIEREEYSLNDIAMMFGVSRERIRQYAERLKIVHPCNRQVGLMCLRVWDDQLNTFKPVPKGVVRRERVIKRRKADRATRLNRVLDGLRRCRERLGREPMWKELELEVFGSNGTNAVLRLTGHIAFTSKLSTRAKTERFCLLTGYVPYALGHYPTICGRRWRRANLG